MRDFFEYVRERHTERRRVGYDGRDRYIGRLLFEVRKAFGGDLKANQGGNTQMRPCRNAGAFYFELKNT